MTFAKLNDINSWKNTERRLCEERPVCTVATFLFMCVICLMLPFLFLHCSVVALFKSHDVFELDWGATLHHTQVVLLLSDAEFNVTSREGILSHGWLHSGPLLDACLQAAHVGGMC